MDGTQKPLSHRRKSGSENRKRDWRISSRVTAEEYAEVEAAAAARGLTLASHARLMLVNAPKTKTRRRASVEVATLAAMLGQVRKAGSNIYQILKRVNFGETPAGEEIRRAAKTCDEAAAAILEVM